jgi:hypothetical protein
MTAREVVAAVEGRTGSPALLTSAMAEARESRCRCGKLKAEPHPGCTWHEARAERASDPVRQAAALKSVQDMCAMAREARRRFPVKSNDTRPIYLEVEQIEAAITAALEAP